MKDEVQILTKDFHRYCINLEPEYYFFLIELSENKFDGDMEQTFLYLISKYMKYLYKIKIGGSKIATQYQPTTKKYEKFWIEMNPTHMAKLKNLRFYLGYSVSFIIRILIEWEKQELHQVEVLIPKPILTPQELSEIKPTLLHSYDMGVRANYANRLVYMSFRDDFY